MEPWRFTRPDEQLYCLFSGVSASEPGQFVLVSGQTAIDYSTVLLAKQGLDEKPCSPAESPYPCVRCGSTEDRLVTGPNIAICERCTVEALPLATQALEWATDYWSQRRPR